MFNLQSTSLIQKKNWKAMQVLEELRYKSNLKRHAAASKAVVEGLAHKEFKVTLYLCEMTIF